MAKIFHQNPELGNKELKLTEKFKASAFSGIEVFHEQVLPKEL
jgi:hypothetical protein